MWACIPPREEYTKQTRTKIHIPTCASIFIYTSPTTVLCMQGDGQCRHTRRRQSNSKEGPTLMRSLCKKINKKQRGKKVRQRVWNGARFVAHGSQYARFALDATSLALKRSQAKISIDCWSEFPLLLSSLFKLQRYMQFLCVFVVLHNTNKNKRFFKVCHNTETTRVPNILLNWRHGQTL